MSMDSEVYNDWCLPHFYDDCSPTSNPRASNLLFGCVSAATVLKNAFVLVQVNRFQQIIGVYTLQAPSYGNKATWLSRLHDAQENYREACRKLDVKRLSTAERAAATAAGVDINVLQCDDNISFADSTNDITAPPQQTGVFGGAPSSSATLLGVPRADGLPVFADPAYRGAGCTRAFRSSSSDAASALQPDSNPQSPTADNSGALPRRTSDPLCGGGAAASGQDTAGLAEHVEIVISLDPHDNTASLSSVNSSGTGSSAKLPAGCGLAPPPILSANYWSSATSLCHFPTTTFASSAIADSKPSVLSQSVSSCSLNPPSALLKQSLISNTLYSHQLSDRHQSRPRRTLSERVGARLSREDERRQSSLEESDDDESGGSVCSGSMFRANRGSESTPLLTQQVRGRRVDVPSSLICCTPPRHRHVPRPNPPMSPLAAVTPPLSANSPTDVDVAEFCAPAARPKRTRHASLHRRSRRAALINAKHDRWQSIDLPDT